MTESYDNKRLCARKKAAASIYCSLIGFLLLVPIVCPGHVLGLDAPPYRGYVNDYADMISPAAEQAIEQTLEAFDRSDSTQISILTIESLEGDSLEDFSIRVVDKWKIGRKGKDNGVLLLAVKKEHDLRIEVGRGLEGLLTDLLAGRIVDTVIVPNFKQGEFDAGFEAGVAAIIKATHGEFKPDGQRPGGRRGQANSKFSYLIFVLILISVIGRASRFLGIIGGAVALPLLVFLGMSTPLGWLVLIPLALLGGVIGLLLGLIGLGSHRGGFGGFGGGLGGGGFGGGGFGGFGGGGFGGGGASGKW